MKKLLLGIMILAAFSVNAQTLTFERVDTADVVTDLSGVEHPDLILDMTSFYADFKTNTVFMNFNFYHSDQTKLEGKNVIPLELLGMKNNLNLRFTLETTPNYQTVLNLLNFTDSGTYFTNTTAVENWFLDNYNDPLEDQKLGINWKAGE